MRIAVGGLLQETNHFVPFTTTLDTFASYYILHGDELYTGYKDGKIEIPAFLDVLGKAGVTIVPLMSAFAAASGPLTRPTLDTLLGELITRLKEAMPVDGVLLSLHGAMAIEDNPDGEGEILAAVRDVIGPDMPLGVSLDLHGHITPRMVELATFIVGYQEYPHIDIYETGVRTAELFLKTMRGERHPVTALAKRPMVVSAANARTTEGPLHRVWLAAREMEKSGRVLHASLFPVQPWLDVPDLGFAAVVVTDNDLPAAQAAADELADMAWEARAEFEPDLTPLEDAIRIGLESPGLTVVGDAGDAPTGGAAADNITILRALLDAGADKASRPTYLTLRDAEAAQAAAKAGIGSEVTLKVGHKISIADGEPLTVTGRVCLLSDGVYRMKGAGATGLEVRMGLTALLAIGSIRLSIRSNASMEWDPAMYYAVGLDPKDAALVFVKSPSHFRVSYEPLAHRILIADTPGPTRANMRKIDFKHVTRPLYPLDEM